jgi:ubiquitin-like protein Pup
VAERIRKTKTVEKKEEKAQEELEASVDAEAEKLKAETDELLDEIDGLLEEDAQAFVSNFIQKGGQAVSITRRIRDIMNVTLGNIKLGAVITWRSTVREKIITLPWN